jgi:hypothetical protein
LERRRVAGTIALGISILQNRLLQLADPYITNAGRLPGAPAGDHSGDPCGSPVGRFSCLGSRAPASRCRRPGSKPQGGLRGSGLSPPAPVDRFAFVAYFPRRAAPAVLEPHREQNHSQLFRWCSRSASARRAVNRRKSPRT